MQVISKGQLLGWMVYAAIRGPIGPLRRDVYAAFQARYGGQQFKAEATVEDIREQLPWWRPEPVDENKEQD
jgi:hypothetical protein